MSASARFRAIAALLAAAAAPLGAQVTEKALENYQMHLFFENSIYKPSAGSLYAPNAFLADAARDARASQVGDLLTVAVAESATALSSGSLSQTRSSDSSSAISSLFGQMGPLRPLPNLFGQNSDSSLQGQGSTSRSTNVTTVLTAHVVAVMPNGNLIIEGAKEVSVNAERQLVWIRGVVRQADLRPDNSIGSERIALMDLRVNGKGVVAEALRRPNAIYRIFRRLLPF